MRRNRDASYLPEMAARRGSAPALPVDPGAGMGAELLEFRAYVRGPGAMIELNPVRQRIADLQGRLDALRGYL